MAIATVTTVLPVSDVRAAVDVWRTILGVEPAFVDGERWAQFNAGTTRIALAGGDQAQRAPAIMLKVDDLAAERARMAQSGASVSDIQAGPHELYFEVHATDGWRATFYCAKPKSE